MSNEYLQEPASVETEPSTSMKENLHPALRAARAVLFDAGGTLVHPDWQRLAALAAEEAGRTFTPAELRQALYKEFQVVDHYLRHKQDAPTYNPVAIFKESSTRCTNALHEPMLVFGFSSDIYHLLL